MTNKKSDGVPSGLIYPELSYQIVGAAFEVFNQIGPGLQEKTYQRALAEELKHLKIAFKEQRRLRVKYRKRIIGDYFLDFLVEEKIIIELKCGDYYSRNHIMQVVRYLKISGHLLAILLNFTRDGVKQKRILNNSSFAYLYFLL